MLEVYSAGVCFKQCNTFFQFLNPLEIKAAFDLFSSSAFQGDALAEQWVEFLPDIFFQTADSV